MSIEAAVISLPKGIAPHEQEIFYAARGKIAIPSNSTFNDSPDNLCSFHSITRNSFKEIGQVIL